jgi:cytochrome c oxidase subunit 4
MSNATSSHHHIAPLSHYLGVFAALLVLTAVTVGVAQIDFGAWNMVVALSVASLKAALVAFIFMHLFYDNKVYFIVFSIALAFLTIFIIFTMFDTMRRDAIYDETARPIRPEAEIYQTQPDSLPQTPDSLIQDSAAASGSR